MSLHHQLPIHRKGVQLLDLAVSAQVQMPRGMKQALGERITDHCIEMLDLMALANASKGAERAGYIGRLLREQRTTEVLLRVCFDKHYVSPKLWATGIELLESIGRQGGGWLKSSTKAPAA